MTTLFRRKVTVTVGEPGEQGREVSSLNADNTPGVSIDFRVNHARREQPSRATLRLYNVTDETAAAFESLTTLVRLSAGHTSRGLGVLFEGNPVRGGVRFSKQGSERVLTVECQDGGRRYRIGRVSLNFDRDTPAAEALAEIVRQTGYPKGKDDLETALPLVRGWAFEGFARDALNELCGLTGRKWFVRDGRLYVLDPRADTGEKAVSITAEDGNLVGSPNRVLLDQTVRVTQPTKKPGLLGGLLGASSTATSVPRNVSLSGIEVTSLLVPEMRPGRVFFVESERFRGYWTAKEVQHHGTSYEGAFHTVIKGLPRA